MPHNNKSLDLTKHEIFSQLEIPPETPFFVRLDGWRFQAVSHAIGAERPFDEDFAKCLVTSGRALFQSNFNPALVYATSDELNTLFLQAVPFRRRVEKIDSVLAGVASSTFSLSIQRLFNKNTAVAFDSRIILSSSQEKINEYLTWRQGDAWRNHNNAYAYWFFRKRGHKPSEASKMLKGLKTKELHEALFSQGIKLAKTPPWQRRGILIYREPYQKNAKNHMVTRRRTKENWNIPIFSSTRGKGLIQQILRWTKSST
jgi:tRNA(His) guanylyltransferase